MFQNRPSPDNCSGPTRRSLLHLLQVTALLSTLIPLNLSAQLPTKGLVQRLRADSSVVTSGSFVTNWNDVSGAGNSVAQTTSGLQPTLVSNSLNGKPAIHFDASNDYLQGGAALDLRNSAFSIFVVAKPTAGDGNYFAMLSSECFRYAANNTKYKNGGTLTYSGTLLASLQSIKRSSAGVVTVTRNGTQLASGSIVTASTTCVNFRIGGDGLSGIGGFDGYNGDIAEVIVYNYELSSAETQAVQNYLNSRYGLTGNASPIVSITSPSNGTSYTAPATVTINANASDSDGTISQVEFYNGSNLLGTDNSSPYSITWSNVAAGSWSLTARVTKNAGAVTTSAAVNITVNGASDSPLLTSFTPADARNGHQGFLGMRITVGDSNINVTDLGRIFLTGNTGTHTVKIVNGSSGADMLNGSVSISMPGGTHNQFKYVSLPVPVSLTAGQVYYIVSDEVSTGDQFYDSMTFTNAAVAACNSGVYFDGSGWVTTGYPYCVASFKYTAGGEGRVPLP